MVDKINRRLITLYPNGTRTVKNRMMSLAQIAREDARDNEFTPNPEDPELRDSLEGGPDWESPANMLPNRMD